MREKIDIFSQIKKISWSDCSFFSAGFRLVGTALIGDGRRVGRRRNRWPSPTRDAVPEATANTRRGRGVRQELWPPPVSPVLASTVRLA